jgi:type IV secretion system protein VirB11
MNLDRLTEQERLVLSFFDPDVVDLFESKTLTDIFWNPDGKIYIKDKGVETYLKDFRGSLRVLINELAHINEVVINEANPVLETSFLGMRITAAIPPIVSMPTLTIRKPNYNIIPLRKYLEDKSLSQGHYQEILNRFIDNPENWLIVGGTGSGKTTFANAMINELSIQNNPSQRIVSIQDTPELVIKCPNVLELFSTSKFSMQDCLKLTLRQSPKRIFVGEVRDKSVLAMMDAWNTGHHGGVATIHANSALDAIQRIISLGAKDYDLNELYNLIATTIGVIISIQEHNDHRTIKEVILIEGYDPDKKCLITKTL